MYTFITITPGWWRGNGKRRWYDETLCERWCGQLVELSENQEFGKRSLSCYQKFCRIWNSFSWMKSLESRFGGWVVGRGPIGNNPSLVQIMNGLSPNQWWPNFNNAYMRHSTLMIQRKCFFNNKACRQRFYGHRIKFIAYYILTLCDKWKSCVCHRSCIHNIYGGAKGPWKVWIACFRHQFPPTIWYNLMSFCQYGNTRAIVKYCQYCFIADILAFE